MDYNVIYELLHVQMVTFFSFFNSRKEKGKKTSERNISHLIWNKGLRRQLSSIMYESLQLSNIAPIIQHEENRLFELVSTWTYYAKILIARVMMVEKWMQSLDSQGYKLLTSNPLSRIKCQHFLYKVNSSRVHMGKLLAKRLPTIKRKLPDVSFCIFIQKPQISLWRSAN